MKTEQEQIEAATMAIAREVCPYYNRGRCDLGSPTCHKTSIQLCPRKEAIVDSLNRIVKQAQLNVLGKLWSNISNSKQLIQSHIADGSFTIEDIYMEIDELMEEVQNAEDKG